MGKKAGAKKRRQQQQQQQRGYSTTSTSAKPALTKPNSSHVSKTANNNGTGNSTTTTNSQSNVTSQTHQELLNLLGTLDDEDHQQMMANGGGQTTTSSSTSTTFLTPERLYKKLYNIHDTLDQLGFSFENMERVVATLGKDITLESALDWLCLHLKTQDLPPLLTEGSVREQEQLEKQQSNNSNASSSLTVLKPTTTTTTTTRRSADHNVDKSSGEESVVHTIEPLSPPPPPTSEMSARDTKPSKKAEEKDDTKAWILQQYQYEDDDDDDDLYQETDVLPMDEPSRKEVPSQQKPQQQQQQQQQPPTPSETDYVDPAQGRLNELEEQLRLQEADVNDEAANYMRSKHEIKELKASTKKLRQQVQGLKKKIEKNKAQAAAASASSMDNNGTSGTMEDTAEEEGGGGIFGIFNEEEEEEGGDGGIFSSVVDRGSADGNTQQDNSKAANVEEEGPPPSDPVVPIDSVPAGWTGKTPKEILEDWCKKEKLRRPQFFKSTRWNGARVRVDVKPTELSMETDNYMGSYSDAQQYLATKVLYELNPDLPLYRLFPPFYRDLWCSWTEKVQLEKDTQAQQESDAIRQKVERLMDCVPKPKQSTAEQGLNDKQKRDNKSEREDRDTGAPPVTDCWEDDDEGDFTVDEMKTPSVPDSRNRNVNGGAQTRDSSSPSHAGDAIKNMFIKRQKTSKYQEMLKARTALPMYSYRQKVLEMIQENPVLILCAETGAGKTTQCPQFLLEDAFMSGKGDQVNVICTQPRRVAATSVAERVSDEMGERNVGDTVGYQIRLEAKRSSQTRLLYCTTGVVLRRLQDDPMLTGVTHIVVDEVHERQYQVDCLLVMLRQLLRNGRPDLKVILMSATLDAKLFCNFFNGAPVINVPGRTFPVANYYLEDLLDGTNHIIEEGSRYALREEKGRETASIEITTRGGEKRKEVHALSADGAHLADVSDDYPNHKISTRRSMDRVNEEVINYDLIEDLLVLLLVEPERNDVLLPPEGSRISENDGSVLVFLPGFGEIKSLTDRLEGSRIFGNRNRFEIVPMHSTLSPQDQRRAFTMPRKGCRKIVLSTNICETSVTIPSVVCVVDTGRVREVRVDKRTSTSKLVTDWCSRQSTKQRAGRAGRVQPGICLKLYSSKTAEFTMNEASQPEIRRVPLEDVCLSILAGSFAQNCMEFLSQTPQPPAEEAVGSALRILNEVGAIKLVTNGPSATRSSEELTPLGRHLSRLPVDVRLGKMLIYGALFSCVDPALTVAASLSCKSPFSTFVNDALQAKAKHNLFAHPQSDFLTLCNVFEQYDKAQSKGTSQARRFCNENFLSFSALKEISDTRRHFTDLLAGIGFLKISKLAEGTDGEGKKKRWNSQSLSVSPYNANKENLDVVHSVICAGLYPHVAHLVPTASGSGERPLWHRNEQLHFHSSSVNSKLKATHRYPTSYITFHEKFGTQSRTSVSTTCFVHPFAILVFGGDLVVKHTERRVIVDDWIELPLAAQTGVMFREVRKQMEHLLQGFLDTKRSSPLASEERASAMINGIVRLLSTGTTTALSNN